MHVWAFQSTEREHSGNVEVLHIFSDCHNISIFSWCAHSLGSCSYLRFFLFVISFNPHWLRSNTYCDWDVSIASQMLSRTSRDLNSGFSWFRICSLLIALQKNSRIHAMETCLLPHGCRVSYCLWPCSQVWTWSQQLRWEEGSAFQNTTVWGPM